VDSRLDRGDQYRQVQSRVSLSLTVVDVFSKHAWVQPLKNKTGKAVTEAMAKILKGGRKPINLKTDDGKEFYNKTFQDLMKQKGIHHFSTRGDTKSSVVERFNRTLKDTGTSPCRIR